MHVTAVDILVAVLAVHLRAGLHRQIEIHIHRHAEPVVGAGIVGAFIAAGVLTVVHVVGGACVLPFCAVVGVGMDGFAVCVGVGRVEGQEIGIFAAVFGTRRVPGALQILVHIEPSVALIIGGGVQLGVIVIVAVVLVAGVQAQLEQMVRGADVGLAGKLHRRIKENVPDGIGIEAGIDGTGIRGVIAVVMAVGVGDILAAPVPVTEDEIGVGLAVVGVIAGGQQVPCLAVAVCRNGHIHILGNHIQQRAIVKEPGGDEVVGADGVGYLIVEPAHIVGGGLPVGVEHRVAGDGVGIAGGVVLVVDDIVPALEDIGVFIRGLPLVRQGQNCAGGGGGGGVGRSPQAHDAAVGAVQPDGAGTGNGYPEGAVLAGIAGHPEVHGVPVEAHIGAVAEPEVAIVGGHGGAPATGGGDAVVGGAVVIGVQMAAGGHILDGVGAIVVPGYRPENPVGIPGHMHGAVGIHLDGDGIAGAVDGMVGAACVNVEHIAVGAVAQLAAVIIDGAGHGGHAGRGRRLHNMAGILRHQTVAYDGRVGNGIGQLRHGAVHIAQNHRHRIVKDSGDDAHTGSTGAGIGINRRGDCGGFFGKGFRGGDFFGNGFRGNGFLGSGFLGNGFFGNGFGGGGFGRLRLGDCGAQRCGHCLGIQKQQVAYMGGVSLGALIVAGGFPLQPEGFRTGVKGDILYPCVVQAEGREHG